jgi:uncharacterized membrane protein
VTLKQAEQKINQAQETSLAQDSKTYGMAIAAYIVAVAILALAKQVGRLANAYAINHAGYRKAKATGSTDDRVDLVD